MPPAESQKSIITAASINSGVAFGLRKPGIATTTIYLLKVGSI
jgi:hypothetical protein